MREQRISDQTRLRPIDWLGPAAISLAGLALRWWNIESQPLWGDEALTLLTSQWPASLLFLFPADPTPGLYYFLHKTLIGSTESVAMARSISLVAGALLVPVMFFAARACRLPALLTAALTALSFPLIDYSQEARAYSLLLLWVGLSALAFVHWTRNGSGQSLAGLLIANLLALYTHFVAIFWVGPLMLAMVVLGWRDPTRRRIARLACYALAIFALPEALRLMAYPRDSFVWLKQASPVGAMNELGYVLLPFGLIENRAWHFGLQLTALACLATFLVLGILAWSRRGKIRRWAKDNSGAAAVILISLAIPVAIWLFGFVSNPVFMPRTLLIALPGFILGLALLLSQLHRAAGVVAVLLYALSLAFTGTIRPREQWRPMAETIAANARAGDVVLVCPGWKSTAFRHAFKGRVDVPLIALWPNDRFMMMEARLGSDPDWIRTYFDVLTKRKGFAEGQASVAGARRVWRVNSKCDVP